MKPRRPAARPASRARAGRRAAEVRLEAGALWVGGAEVPLLCGAVHYFRLERQCWRAALAQTRALGLPIVETYVPWQVHEIAPGEHDFGQHDPQKDLGAFLDLVRELGLYAFLRPGPHVNSEMTYFGLPERIVFDPAVQARSPRQSPVVLAFPPRMFPVPSYASARYHEQTGRWYDAVAQVVRPRLFPAGPVVLLQVDNEAALWFRDAPYDQDYHADAIAWWREWLEQRYGTPEAVARAHRRPYARFEDVVPPERFDAERPEDLVLHLDWAAFHEHMTTRAIRRFQARMAEAGLRGVPTVHNLPLGEQSAPASAPALETVVDVAGLDFYHARREHQTIKRRALYLAGTSRLPFAPEMGAGAPYWFTPLTHEDSLFCAMAAAAYGVRGMNLYMAVDRDRWYGAPIDARGNPRLEAGAWKAFFHALTSVRFHALRREVAIALVVPREYARLGRATHLLGPVTPVVLEASTGRPAAGSSDEPLGFAGPIQTLLWRTLGLLADALTSAGVPYVYVDGDAPPERLAGMRAVFAPSYEFASVERWRTLCACAADGAHVVYGPLMPTLDETMSPRPFEVPRHARRVAIETRQDAETLVAALVRDLDLPRPFRATPAPIETTVHSDARGPRVLFVIHPGPERVEARIALPWAMTLEDAMTGESFAGEREFRLHPSPGTVRMLVIRRSAAEEGMHAATGSSA